MQNVAKSSCNLKIKKVIKNQDATTQPQDGSKTLQEYAKDLAKFEVLRRVVTLDQAKESYKKWIKDALALGGYTQATIDFWNEVYRMVDEVAIEQPK